MKLTIMRRECYNDTISIKIVELTDIKEIRWTHHQLEYTRINKPYWVKLEDNEEILKIEP